MLLHRLCVALGVLHPDELLARLSWPQIADWYAYMEREPFGPHAEAWRSAAVQADIRNYAQVSKKRNWKPSDFLPKPPPPADKPGAVIPLSQKIRAGFGAYRGTRRKTRDSAPKEP